MNTDNRLLALAIKMKAIQARMDEMDVEWKALTKELDGQDSGSAEGVEK